MAVCFSFLLIVFGLKGIYSVTTVNKVSVKAGHSLTIPCLYQPKYINHVKYLCKGASWQSCSSAVKSNRPDASGKFAISDDKTKRIFTVTINDLTDKDAGYWCNVEINHGTDVGQSFHLSVTTGTPGLYVDQQEITGFYGDSITVQINSSNSGEMKLCRLGRFCVTGPSGLIDNTAVTIKEKTHNVFTMTMSGLMTESSGWYFFVKGDLQMPVHLTVVEKPSTTMLSPTTDKSGEKTITTFENKSAINVKRLIILLTLLIFTVMVIMSVWFMLRKHKHGKGKSSATVMAEEEITYCDVKHKSKTSHQLNSNGRITDGDDVIYSNVGYMREISRQMPYPEGDVVYSSVVTKK